jgi:hypothetical protein
LIHGEGFGNDGGAFPSLPAEKDTAVKNPPPVYLNIGDILLKADIAGVQACNQRKATVGGRAVPGILGMA